MTGLIRSTASLLGAAAITAWILFEAPAPRLAASAPPPPLRVDLAAVAEELSAMRAEAEAEPAESSEPPATPPVDVTAPSSEEAPAPAESPEPVEAAAPIAPPEAGSRAGDEAGDADALTETSEAESEVEADASPDPDDADAASTDDRPEADGPAAAESPSAASLASDPDLLAAAHVELSGEADVGFSTVLHSEAANQLDIARAFGEEVVLVPRAALDPEAAHPPTWYRIAPDSLRSGRPRVEEVSGPPPTERYRRYRDLFPFEYSRLPSALRELRSSTVRRSDVFVFAALIPPSEWAVVIGRRRAALDALGLTEEDVEQFVLQYVRLSGGEIDILVDRVITADGRRLHPSTPR